MVKIAIIHVLLAMAKRIMIVFLVLIIEYNKMAYVIAKKDITKILIFKYVPNVIMFVKLV